MSWPVAHTYDHEDRARISLPVGGIGTGTVGFGGRGQFRDWELESHPSKGLSSTLTFLSIWCRGAGGEPVARVLEGHFSTTKSRVNRALLPRLPGFPGSEHKQEGASMTILGRASAS